MHLSNDRYESIKRSVVEFIKKYNITAYPLNVKVLCKKMNIPLVPYSKFSDVEREYAISQSEDGYFVHKDGVPIGIAYNDLKYGDRITTTIGHEIGHLARDHKEQSELADSEADFFAVYLLTPNPLLDKCNIESYMDIYHKFNVSKTLAINSWKRYISWKKNRKKHNFSFTDYEQELIDRIEFK